MCLYSVPIVQCAYIGKEGQRGVEAQSVTQILVAPLKLGPITAVTHHCCWAFTLMMTMMTTMTMMTMITMMTVRPLTPSEEEISGDVCC